MKQFRKLFLLICLAWGSANAQIAVSGDALGGTPLAGQSYMNVKGTPYLLENWEKGSVTLASGKKFENLDLKFDQVINQVIFQDMDGSMKAFSQPIIAFTIGKDANGHQFHRGLDGIFYEKLLNGRITLWKKNHKTLIDEKPYGSATVQRNVLNNFTYYVGELTQLTKIKTDKKSVLELLADKSSDIEAFIKKEKLNPRTENDLVRVIMYYNGL
ncbi:hypothetical protein [Emticicia sp. BO119]|uniref:hypothetical protein n=1 Tax=Emticicia sp. BO119 TaxID=2757768 RepID=UPI0015F0E86F|nr:hypothetical protein [Emticicia sp. BO119]